MGKDELQLTPPSILNCSVPPLPLSVPREMEPPLTTQFVQVLLMIASVPVGAGGVVQVPGTVVPTVALPLLHPFVERTLAIMVWAGPVWLYVGKDELQLTPPSVLNCNVPPLPLNVPREIEPPLTVQFVQVLLVMDSVPAGTDGVVQLPGEVLPTRVMLLLQPFTESTLA
jgi:hypothetical protein